MGGGGTNDSSSIGRSCSMALLGPLMDDIGQLAYTQTWLSCTQETNLQGGEYYTVETARKNLKEYTRDEQYQASLWELSEKLINDATNV